MKQNLIVLQSHFLIFSVSVSLLFLHPGLGPAMAELKPSSVKRFAEVGKGTYSHKQRHSSEYKLQTRQLFKLFLEPLNEEFLPAEKRTLPNKT